MLKPKDINDVHFSKAIRGYDADEVDKFLDTVVEDYAQLLRDKADLLSENESLKARLSEYERNVDEIKSAKEKIYRLAREVASKANAQAAQTEREAKERAERIIIEAKRDSENQRRLYDRLQLETTRFKAKAIALFKSEIEQLNTLPDTQLDPKDELKIRADEIGEDYDILSSPYVEEYRPKYTALKEIDFGEPKQDDLKERFKEELKINADPKEDFVSRYVSGEHVSDGMFGVSAVPRGFTGEVVDKSEYQPKHDEAETVVSEPETVIDEPKEQEEITVTVPDEPAEITLEPKIEDIANEQQEETFEVEAEEITENDEPADESQSEEEPPAQNVKAAETIVFDIPDEPQAPHTFSVRRLTKEETDVNAPQGEDDEESVSVSEIAQIIPEEREPQQSGRIEGGWFNETEEFETIDTDLEKHEKQREEQKPAATHPKFGDIRFGTDYDISEEEGSHGFSFFKKKKQD